MANWKRLSAAYVLNAGAHRAYDDALKAFNAARDVESAAVNTADKATAARKEAQAEYEKAKLVCELAREVVKANQEPDAKTD